MSKVQDIVNFNHGWFAVDECESAYGYYNETWIGNIRDINNELIGYEYTGGTKWEGLTDDFIQGGSRGATEEEIRRALTAEAKRRYKVPCPITYIDGGESKLQGHFFDYDFEKDALYASDNMDIVYHKGTWAESEDGERLLNIHYTRVFRGGRIYYDFKDKRYTTEDIDTIITFLNSVDDARYSIAEIIDALDKLD